MPEMFFCIPFIPLSPQGELLGRTLGAVSQVQRNTALPQHRSTQGVNGYHPVKRSNRCLELTPMQ